MVQNRIKVLRAEANVSATALADKMPDGIDKVVMSYIEHGRVLPTCEALKSMCIFFGCKPTDIYTLEDIDLASVGSQIERPAQQEVEKPENDNATAIKLDDIKSQDWSGGEHGKDEQFRVWMTMEDKAALVKAVRGLGYKSLAEWLREMYRQTLHKYIALGLENVKSLHEAVPPTTKIKQPDVV